MVVSLSGLVKQLFKDAGCGFSTEPFDAQAVFDSIMNIYRMPAEKRTAMGQQCRNYQETHFSLDQCTEQILSVLRKEQPEDEKSQPEIRQLWDL